MPPQTIFTKNLTYAAFCVFLVLITILISVALIDFVIAPLLVSVTRQLSHVEWQQVLNLCYLSGYILLFVVVVVRLFNKKNSLTQK
jgi:cellulose synthase/poly-beta-1,6-N-acetylglucosamine synthase-like glycosyltransferase